MKGPTAGIWSRNVSPSRTGKEPKEESGGHGRKKDHPIKPKIIEIYCLINFLAIQPSFVV